MNPLRHDAVTAGLLHLDRPLPARFEAGPGNVLVLTGTSEYRNGELAVLVDGRRHRLQHRYELRTDAAVQPDTGPAWQACRGFWAAVPLVNVGADQTVNIAAESNHGKGAPSRCPLGAVTLTAAHREPLPVADTAAGSQPLIAVCLAAFEPDAAAFERQIESIRKQSHANWLCIVNDDASQPASGAAMQAICARDARIVYRRNATNLGFYCNFEQCLRLVPDAAQFVALADQDDCWYPDKLERLLAAFDDTTVLSYCDMRIVDAGGAVRAPTYWTNRRNEYRDARVVLCANTVTGAASLFRRELLDVILPFPPRIGDAFHDHWIACVAMTRGRLAYVDAPLYDYYQYGDSVIGHCDFVPWPLHQRAASLIRTVARLLWPATAKAFVQRVRSGSLAVYHCECRRLEVISEILRLRSPAAAGQPQLRLFGRGLGSFWRLLALHVEFLLRGKTTDDAELRLALGYLFKRVDEWRLAWRFHRRAAHTAARSEARQ